MVHATSITRTYNDDTGHTVVIQSPGKLVVGRAQPVSFAKGVHVTGNAVGGRG